MQKKAISLISSRLLSLKERPPRWNQRNIESVMISQALYKSAWRRRKPVSLFIRIKHSRREYCHKRRMGWRFGEVESFSRVSDPWKAAIKRFISATFPPTLPWIARIWPLTVLHFPVYNPRLLPCFQRLCYNSLDTRAFNAHAVVFMIQRYS